MNSTVHTDRDPPPECIAYHEAGHAAMHFVAGRRFREVTVKPTDETLGRCVRWLSPPRFRPDIVVTPRGEVYLRDLIVSLLAGELADTRHCGRQDSTTVHEADDFSKAADLALHLVGSTAELDAYLGWLYTRANAQLARADVWAGLQEIAAALLTHERLDYAESAAAWRRGIHKYVAELSKSGRSHGIFSRAGLTSPD